eukprot:jgi/Ulvmu1/9697/UM055_0035.1
MPSGGREPRMNRQLSNRRIPYDSNDARPRSNRNSRPQQEADEPNMDQIKVSGQSNVKAVAGKLAHTIRGDESAPTILTIGPPSINLAFKAIAVARKYLVDDDQDIVCQPAFREGMSDRSLALYLTPIPGNRVELTSEAVEMTVKERTHRQKLAGAIAGRVRDNEAIYLLAQGADAVANAVSAVCHARMFLEENKLDVQCLPKFIEREADGSKSTFLRIDIRPTTSA